MGTIGSKLKFALKVVGKLIFMWSCRFGLLCGYCILCTKNHVQFYERKSLI